MDNLLFLLIPVAVLAVAAVLVLGLVNLARGGSPERSQSLMRWRVILQAVAIVIMLGALFLANR